MRETFVVVASRQPLDLTDLGRRDDDPQFYHNEPPDRAGSRMRPRMRRSSIESRSRDIILTDDYAPVENLLAPVAETRADD